MSENQEQPIPDEYRFENEMVSAAESNAPPAMLAAQREFDRVAARDYDLPVDESHPL